MMPRKYTKKTERSRKTKEQIKFAVTCVLKDGMKIRRVADDLGFSFSSLQRHVKKAKSLPVEEQDNYEYEANSSSRQVFNAEREKLLCEYLQTCSKMHYGLDTKQTRVFAYEFAKRLGIAYPREWDEHKSAGRDWLLGFMDRNKDLSLRQPEATSLGRSTSFNKHNVGMFFENLKFILDKHKFPAENIFNLDETGCTTVHKPSRVIAMKGQKQVGQVTSGERGKLITVCCFINAAGNTLPPAIVFPLKRFKDHMIMNAPENTLGLACSSGWMTKENFVLVMEHFIKYSGATRKNPCLLLLDNHESHVNLDVVSLAKSNGVHLLTFPPHCSHRLQPLDVSVYGPFKAYYNGAASAWMTSNPGKTLTIYHLPELIKTAFDKAMSRQNILSGFKKSGIHPLDVDIFSEADFLTSSVTDRENPALENHTLFEIETEANDSQRSVDQEHEKRSPNHTPEDQANITLQPDAVSTTAQPRTPKIVITSDIKRTPEMIRPFPKAKPRKVTNKGRKPGKTRILTETPEKEELERQENKKMLKTRKSAKRNVLIHIDESEIAKQQKQSLKTKTLTKRRKKSESEDSDISCSNVSSGESNYVPQELDKDFDHSVNGLNSGDYIVVRFSTESNRKVSPDIHYVGLVENIHSNEKCSVNFMRRRGNSLTFFFPENEDKVDVHTAKLWLSADATLYER
jgi:hypothetical protein